MIDREAFLAGTRRASIFARDSANIVKIEIGGEEADGAGIAITAHAADLGEYPRFGSLLYRFDAADRLTSRSGAFPGSGACPSSSSRSPTSM